jgi:pimeloyl-ACP methyl ester carboxylesterase
MKRTFACLTVLALAGCAGVAPLTDAPQWPPAGIEGGVDLRQAGPNPTRLDILPAVALSNIDCVGDVLVARPSAQADTNTALVFAHGFLRDVRHHRAFALHLASWGTTVYLVGHCNGGWNMTGGGAAALAEMMRRVATTYDIQRVVYGGFSAGGRAARLAAAGDMRTVGLLLLDAVDRVPHDTNLRIATTVPIAALFAPAQPCNANQVGARSLSGKEAVVRELAATTHCHFEAPTDVVCVVACGEPGDAARNDVLRRRMLALSAAFVRWRAEPTAMREAEYRAWWTPYAGVLDEIRK